MDIIFIGMVSMAVILIWVGVWCAYVCFSKNSMSQGFQGVLAVCVGVFLLYGTILNHGSHELESEKQYPVYVGTIGAYYVDDEGKTMLVSSLDSKRVSKIEYISSDENKVVVRKYKKYGVFGISSTKCEYVVCYSTENSEYVQQLGQGSTGMYQEEFELILNDGAYFVETANHYFVRYISDSMIIEMDVPKSEVELLEVDGNTGYFVVMGDNYQIKLPRG